MTIDYREFWNKKILGWEEGRYDLSSSNSASLLERIADYASRSLRYRQTLVIDLLGNRLSGRPVVEVGCGSGLLATKFISAGATSYLGVDLSDAAILEARRRVAVCGAGANISFQSADVRDLHSLPKHAIVVSTGLLDWLSDDELDYLFRWQHGADFLHSISERRLSAKQWLHRLYTYLAYGRRNGGYVPRYYSCSEIATRVGGRPVYIYRDRGLAFGVFLSSFDTGGPVG